MGNRSTLTIVLCLATACGDDDSAGGGRTPLNSAAHSDGTAAGTSWPSTIDIPSSYAAAWKRFSGFVFYDSSSRLRNSIVLGRLMLDEGLRSAGGVACSEEALQTLVDCQLLAPCADEAADECISAFHHAAARCPVLPVRRSMWNMRSASGLLEGEGTIRGERMKSWTTFRTLPN